MVCMRSYDVCLIVELDVKMLSRFDLLLCTKDKHLHRDDWHKDKSFKHGCR